jgi:hypothetical protein
MVLPVRFIFLSPQSILDKIVDIPLGDAIVKIKTAGEDRHLGGLCCRTSWRQKRKDSPHNQ